MWGIYGYGLTAALLASIVTIPRIVIALVGLDAVEGNEFNFAHFTTFVFIVAYIFASLGIGFKPTHEDYYDNKLYNELFNNKDYKIISEKQFWTKYHGYSMNIILIEKVK